MNVWHLLPKIPQLIADVRDLATRLVALHDDPKFKALVDSDPDIKAKSDAISKDARAIQDAFK